MARVDPEHDTNERAEPDEQTMIYDPDTETWIPYAGQPDAESTPHAPAPPIIVEPPGDGETPSDT